MNTCFTNIINELKRIRKTFTKEEIKKKILRCRIVKYGELIRTLLKHEMSLKNCEDDSKKSKSKEKEKKDRILIEYSLDDDCSEMNE